LSGLRLEFSLYPHNILRLLVITQGDELCVPEMVDLRFILHLFLSWMSLRANNNLQVIDAGARSHDIVRRRAQSGTSRRISRTGSGAAVTGV